MSLARLSVNNSVLVNILMVAILVIGGVSLVQIPREMMPEVPLNWVFIITIYPGGSPDEIEKSITIPIEEEIHDLDHIDSITSESSEGASFISVKFEQIGASKFQKAYLDLKAEVDKVTDELPADAEKPLVEEFDSTDFIPVLSVILSGDQPERMLKEIADDLRKRILEVQNVSQVALAGVRDREIWVELSPDRLETYGVTPAEVSGALAAANLNLPAGNMNIGRKEFLVRTVGEFTGAEDVSRVIVRNRPGGDLKVSDLGEVTDTFARSQTRVRSEGSKAILLSVSKRTKGSSIRLIDDIREMCASYEKTLPPGVRISFTNDTSVNIREVLTRMLNNAMLGFILVILLLYLFIGVRNALMTALGIPISFMCTFIFMRYYGSSLNESSIFGLVLVLGIIVDDAIIIVENCYRYFQMGLPAKEAAVRGTEEVTYPVLTATLTTIGAFLPLMLMPGIIGKFMRIIPIVVCMAIAASLVEAFFILPSHFTEWSPRRYVVNRSGRWIVRLRRRYTRVLVRALRRRYVVLFGVLLLTGLSGAIIPLVGVDLFGEEEVSQFSVWVTMPPGTNLDTTDEAVGEIEKRAGSLPREEIDAILSTSGLMQTDTDWYFQSDVGQVILDLVEKKKGRRPLDRIIGDLRERIRDIPGIRSLEFAKVNTGPPLGAPVEVKVQGKHYEKITEIVDILESELRAADGVLEVQDDFLSRKKEMRVRVDPERASRYGLDVYQVASFVRMAYNGAEATKFREVNDEVDVVVKYPEAIREDLNSLERMKIPTRMGVFVPFQNVARLEFVEATPNIKRFNNERAVTIKADIDKTKISLLEANNLLKKKFEKIAPAYPGYRLEFGGEFKEFQESFQSLGILFMIGIFFIYCILGGQFKSFIQPLVILFTVPFAFIGAIFGLILAGSPFTTITLFGMVALAGVAVNDAIVMVTFINNARKRGGSRWLALVEAGRLRLRPVILTSLTTIFGLMPMAFGLGGRSEVWAPLANTIVFGLAVATVMTLFVIPCLYTIFMDDIGGFFRRKLKRPGAYGDPESIPSSTLSNV